MDETRIIRGHPSIGLWVQTDRDNDKYDRKGPLTIITGKVKVFTGSKLLVTSVMILVNTPYLPLCPSKTECLRSEYLKRGVGCRSGDLDGHNEGPTPRNTFDTQKISEPPESSVPSWFGLFSTIPRGLWVGCSTGGNVLEEGV